MEYDLSTSLLSKQFLSIDLPSHFHNLYLDHQNGMLEKDIIGVEITFNS